LFLEALEDRNSPTAISLSVAYNANHQVTLSGQVTVDGTGYHGSTSGVSGMTIIISGAAAGTTETDGDGYYSVTLTADFLGQVNAQTADYTSNIASATLTANQPSIQNFGWVQSPGHFYTFSGQVTGDVMGGMSVSLGGNLEGVSGQSVSVDSEGRFVLTVQLNSVELSSVTATATDWWGIYSEEVSTLVY
jgi:hypothetical protein